MDGKPFSPSKENERRRGLWARSSSVSLPAANLRRGVNVVGIEVVRAPYDAVMNTGAAEEGIFLPRFLRAVVRHAQAAGDVPGRLGCFRRRGAAAWARRLERGRAGGRPRFRFLQSGGAAAAVRIVGPRNGIFSGKVRVGSTEPLTGLSAVMSELKGQGGGDTRVGGARALRSGVGHGQRVLRLRHHVGPRPGSTTG